MTTEKFVAYLFGLLGFVLMLVALDLVWWKSWLFLIGLVIWSAAKDYVRTLETNENRRR